jgi:hypothetical protein
MVETPYACRFGAQELMVKRKEARSRHRQQFWFRTWVTHWAVYI